MEENLDPTLEILKSHLDVVLGNWFSVALLEQWGWATRPPEVPSHLSHSVILLFCFSTQKQLFVLKLAVF